MGSILTFIAIQNIVEMIISIQALTFNGIFMIALVKKKTLHNPSNAALGCLCCSDLFIGLLGCCMSMLLVVQISGSSSYKFDTYILVFQARALFICLSLMFVVFVNIDRYAAICHPFKYLKYATAKLYAVIAAFACIFSVAATGTFIVLTRFYEINSVYVIFIFNFTAAAIALVYCNLSIIRVTRRHSREIASVGRQDYRQRSRYQSDIKRYYIFVLLVIIFVLCKLPGIIIMLLHFVVSLETTTLFNYFVLASNTICLVDSLLNPLVYYFRLQVFRNAIKDVFCSQRQA